MRLKNTSRYPDDEVKRIVGFACKGVDMRLVEVHVKNCSKSYRGRAYSAVPHVANTAPTVQRLVTIGIGKPHMFPTTNICTKTRWFAWHDLADTQTYLNEAHAEGDRLEARVTMEHRGTDPGVQRRYGVDYQQPYGGKRSPAMTYHTWQEALCAIAAHEARHIHQFRHRKPLSEGDCERWAAKRLDAYRTEVSGGSI